MSRTSASSGAPESARPPSAGRTALDVAVVLTVVGLVIVNSALAPANTYAHAQLQQLGTVVGTIEGFREAGGFDAASWMLPRDHIGGVARKPPLYAWLTVPVLLGGGSYTDVIFRLPTIVASLVTALLIYALGRRWFGRRVGLLAGCLWAAPHHMAKLMYIGVTDMMMTMWLTAAVLCADRLLFDRAPGARRRRWVVGLWAMLIGGTLTKGPAVLILAGAILLPAVVLAPGLRPLRLARGWVAKAALAARLVGRRCRRAFKAVRFGWGMLTWLAVLAPVLGTMLYLGGAEFRSVLYYEYFARITGKGQSVPHSASAPAALHLLYYLLPTSIFALAALLLAPWRRGRGERRKLAVAACWVAGVVVPFSLTHGFRPDYLLPCYAGAALIAAWAVAAVWRLGPDGGRRVSFCRHLLAGAAITLGVLVAGTSLIYALGTWCPSAVRKALPLPAYFSGTLQALLWPLAIAAAVSIPLAVRWSLRWRLGPLVALTVALSLGVMVLDRHCFSRHARTGDGERMLRFTRQVEGRIGDEEFAVVKTGKLTTELYLGRFGTKATDVAALNAMACRWLITNDRGLIELGAARSDPAGPVRLKTPRGRERYVTRPGELGTVHLATEPIISQRWGRLYLIALARPIAVSGRAVLTGHQSGRQEQE